MGKCHWRKNMIWKNLQKCRIIKNLKEYSIFKKSNLVKGKTKSNHPMNMMKKLKKKSQSNLKKIGVK